MKILKRYCGYVIILYFIDANANRMFELRTDEIMEMMLRDSYKGKFQKLFPTYKSTITNSKKRITKTFPTKTLVLTPTPLKKKSTNMTLEKYYARKRRIDLKMLLNNVHPMPDFDTEEDEITIQTRRFNSIGKTQPKAVLREKFYSYENVTLIKREKKRLTSLMAQFVYETKYSLPYAQLLRKKYRHDYLYQIGFCFALIRTLKHQQKLMYSTLHYLQKRLINMQAHMKLYEKIIRLDIDIKDLFAFIKILHEKKETEQKKKVPR